MLSKTPNLVHRNAERFKWHEHVIRDRSLTEADLRLAGWIMHRFSAERGCATVAHRPTAELLGISERTVLRARDRLLERGWIYRINAWKPGQLNGSARYALGSGPEDLIFSSHADTGVST